jgi:PEP-CTERM motif
MALRTLLATAGLLAVGAAQAVPVAWTDWSSITSTGATGTMGGVSVTAVTNLGTVINGPASQVGGPCTNYWTGPAYTQGTVSNGPTACEQVSLNSAVSITVTFGQAIDNLYMALLSVGQPSVQITYDYDRAFVVDSEGLGFWGDGTYSLGTDDKLVMNEFHGVVRFMAPVTSMTFTTSPNENWHAFTFGSGPALPEPGSLALVGLALAGLAGAQRVARARTASK